MPSWEVPRLWNADEDVRAPPPLNAFVEEGITFEPSTTERRAEEKAWREGKVDARSCVHCNTLTYAHHMPLLMQSNFKSAPPPFMEEIRRDMRVVVREADHIVLMGYSLPPDDVTYRAFFAARQRRGDPKVKCSVVVGQDQPPRWMRHQEWKGLLSDPGMPSKEALESARALSARKTSASTVAAFPTCCWTETR